METPGMFRGFGDLRVVLVGCGLTGVVLMGVPCGSKGGSEPGPAPVTITTSFSPSNPRVDPSIAAAEAATLVLDGIDGTFVFVGGQRWLDYENRTARLEAELADAGNRARVFRLELVASDFRFPSQLGTAGFALALDPSAYADGGGSIDTDEWTAFASVSGSLVGERDLDGIELSLELDADAVLQVGEGANNANPYFGAYAPLLWHRATGTGIPEGGNATLSLTLQADTVAAAYSAVSTEPFHGSGHRHAITLPGIANTLVFVAGGQFTERPDGTARLFGVVHEETDPSKAFHVDVRLSGRITVEDANYPPAGSPKLELNTSAYAVNGGVVDPSIWTYYEAFEGTLIGLRSFSGARLQVVRRGPAFQVGYGASGKNANYGGAGWLDTIVLDQPTTGVALAGSTGGDINIDLDGAGSGQCAMPADRDGLARYSGGHAFWLPGIARDFVFEPGALLTEAADGSATLEGVIYSASDPSLRFVARVDLADRIDPQSPGHPPQMSPKLELVGSAYASNGGPVDPAGWHYYGTVVGTLEGAGRMKGARIRVERFGPAAQVGFGASGKNQNYGLSTWLDVIVEAQPNQGAPLDTQQPRGDINIDLGGECGVCAAAAFTDLELSRYAGGHAFYLPGISHDFVFESGASFVERPDGTATLSGMLMSPSRPGWRFRSTVDFWDRIDPSQAGYPPTGAPKKELVADSYADAGGPIDTDTWRYYLGTSGRLEGLDLLEGALVEITRFGPPMQVGLGAGGKSFAFSAASWIDVALLEQPTTGVSLPGQLERGDINVDLMPGCMECAFGAPNDPQASNLGGYAAFWLQGLGSSTFGFEGGGRFEEKGDGTATLSGVIVDLTGGDNRWAVELRFRDRFDPSFGDSVPAESPYRQLRAERYVDAGGPIDPSRWRYYAHTEGELIGLGQHDGAVIEVSRMGPSFQVGHGASGRNEEWGASGWLHTNVTAQPTSGPFVQVGAGDFNVDLGGCDVCAAPAELDSDATSTSGGHSFYFPGIGTDFVFEGTAPFLERPDGTATLTGVIFRPNEPQKRFRVEVDLWDRVDPGMADYPPQDSPKLELRPQYYVTGGGDVDPTAWHYYESFEGRAFGEGEFEGGELYFTRMGPSFQVGLGASGKNASYGASGWLDVQIVQQPTTIQTFTIPAGFHGDINVDLGTGCE